MVRVMATGVFDLLHTGHLHFLQSAKALGDELVVVVATDATVRRRKHEPITPQEMRREMVAALKMVDVGLEGRLLSAGHGVSIGPRALHCVAPVYLAPWRQGDQPGFVFLRARRLQSPARCELSAGA